MACKEGIQNRAGRLEIPNCDDPVFRAWCAACGLTQGRSYQPHDLRIQRLQELMDDPRYDPEQDTADDYLTRGI